MKTSYNHELRKASAGKYAIGGFNFDNLAMLKGIIQAAEMVQAPVLLMVTESSAKAMGVDYVFAITQVARKHAKVPVLVHWDHGYDLNLIHQAILHGFDSVMLDASLKPMTINIQETQQVVMWARAHQVGVESEIGHVGGKEDDTVSHVTDRYTTVASACNFTAATDIDGLAVAVGTIHGVYKEAVNLQIDLIRQIKEAVATPLVLHGSSGVPDNQLQAAIQAGISKVNIGTDLKIAYADGLKQTFAAHPTLYDARKFTAQATKAMIAVVVEKMKILGSAGKA